MWRRAVQGHHAGRQGRLKRIGLPAGAGGTQGGFRKLNLSLLYLPLPNWTLYGNLPAQRAGKNLDKCHSAARRVCVPIPWVMRREYHDVQATVELRYALPQVFGAAPSIVPFADGGRVQINRNPFAAGLHSRSLGAAGVGFTLTKSDDYALRLFWAAKIPGDIATADTDRYGRAWLQALKFF